MRDGEPCKLADVELIAPNGRECGHECHGGCGGRLHGINKHNHRICHTCTSKRSLSNRLSAKRDKAFYDQARQRRTNPVRRSPGSGSTLGRNLRVPGLLDQKEELNDTGGRGCECRGWEVDGAAAPLGCFFLAYEVLEPFAQSVGNTEAGHFLRRAKMSFLEAHAANPARQADMRMFVES